MMSNPRRKTKLTAAKQTCAQSRSRSETRLVFPSATNPHAGEAALSQLVKDWVLPRLLEEFLREKGITPKSRFSSI
jgi:hypothetical protein